MVYYIDESDSTVYQFMRRNKHFIYLKILNGPHAGHIAPMWKWSINNLLKFCPKIKVQMLREI